MVTSSLSVSFTPVGILRSANSSGATLTLLPVASGLSVTMSNGSSSINDPRTSISANALSKSAWAQSSADTETIETIAKKAIINEDLSD